jgi:ATP/maltotriose-dependent transcriptional regulator MalT
MAITEERERELAKAFGKIFAESLDQGEGAPEFTSEMSWKALNAEIPCTQEEFDYCMSHLERVLSQLIEKERRTRLP